MESNSTQRLGCRAEFQQWTAIACAELDWEWEGDPPGAQRCRKHVARSSAISLTQSHMHVIACLFTASRFTRHGEVSAASNTNTSTAAANRS